LRPARDEEFTYLGDATVRRPDPGALGRCDRRMVARLRLSARQPGRARTSEYWYHGGGCRSWLVVTRNTRTHEISDVEARGLCGATAERPE
jgi:heterotetrameric sarcosine oxidase delta subunit